MTFQRDMAWEHFDKLQQSSISHQFAAYALGLTYDAMPEDVVHMAKRCLLDTLGCAMGAYDAPGRPICEQVVKDLGGPAEATLFGSGMRTSAWNATLVNSFLVRFLDFNDAGGGGHNSDAIPGVLAIGERQKASGRDFLTAVVITYELGARFADRSGPRKPGMKWGGWFSDTRAGVSMPAAMGKLMGLNADQIANAIGVCLSGNPVMHVQDTSFEDKTMRKNLRFGWVSCASVVACLLAKNGFTGPVRAIEGELGMNEVMFNGGMNLEGMTDFSGWRILGTRFKYYCCQLNLQAGVGGTLAIVTENDLKPQDIAAVTLTMKPSDLTRATTPIKYPRNAETADHSLYYLNAYAIKERSCGAESSQPKFFTDPVILDLIERISVEKEPKLDEHECFVDIDTKDGRHFKKHVASPHGFADDPLTDAEIEEKFMKMASKRMSDQQAKKLIDTVWNIEKLKDISELTQQMIFKSR